MSIRFPAWPIKRLLREAARAWNLRHPENCCDPEKSDWSFVCNVVFAYLRHELSDYDRIVDPDTREKLRAQVVAAARKAYPWLRPETDPRTKEQHCGNSDGQKHYRVLAEASSQLACLVSIRAHLIEAKRREKDRAQKKSIAEKIKIVEEVIERRQSLFQKFPNLDGKPDSEFIIWDLDLPRYSFGCRDDLPPNYIEDVGFKCPKCDKTVMRTKRPLDLGAGIKLVCLSCHCLSIAVSREYAGANVEAWASLLEPENGEIYENER